MNIWTRLYYTHNLKSKEMKRNVLSASVLILAFWGSIYVSGENRIQNPDIDNNVLDSIQYKIEYAMYESFTEGKTASLDKIHNQLQEIKPQNNIVTYWMAYVNYYQSVLFLKTKDKDSCLLKINSGIELLEKQQKKNSEDYALLALLQSFSIQFKSGLAAGRISAKVTDNAEKAIGLDSLNLRAWYVLATNDFYTPDNFGGGKKTEAYLKKAISLPDQSQKSTYLPSWGKEYAYELLIQCYLKKDMPDDAREIFKSAIQLFPDSYTIKFLC
jgi:pentatricopeptide repeat protein